MSTDYQTQRVLSDIQSKISNLDYRLMRMTAGAPGSPRPGGLFFAQALASLHRLRGNHEQADALLQKAATSPASTTVATWATELTQSPVGGLLLAIQKQIRLRQPGRAHGRIFHRQRDDAEGSGRRRGCCVVRRGGRAGCREPG